MADYTDKISFVVAARSLTCGQSGTHIVRQWAWCRKLEMGYPRWKSDDTNQKRRRRKMRSGSWRPAELIPLGRRRKVCTDERDARKPGSVDAKPMCRLQKVYARKPPPADTKPMYRRRKSHEIYLYRWEPACSALYP